MVKYVNLTNEDFKIAKCFCLDEMEQLNGNVPYEYVKDYIKKYCKNKIWSIKTNNSSETSYGLKHNIERKYKEEHTDLDYGYCTNNIVKLALIELGYDIYKGNTFICNNELFYTNYKNSFMLDDVINPNCNFLYKLTK